MTKRNSLKIIAAVLISTTIAGTLSYFNREGTGDWEYTLKVDPITDEVMSVATLNTEARYDGRKIELACRSNSDTFLMLNGRGSWPAPEKEGGDVPAQWRFDKDKAVTVQMTDSPSIWLSLNADKTKRYMQRMATAEKLFIRIGNEDWEFSNLDGRTSSTKR
jgi:hypothetical protein